MSNVLQFPSPGKIKLEGSYTPLVALGGVKSLWQIGIISTEAFFLAAQVCYRMHAAESNQIVMSWGEGTRSYITIRGRALTGPLQSLRKEDFALALLELHTNGGVLNGLDKKLLNPAGNPRQHFTVPHPMRRPVFWDEKTPIVFRLADYTAGGYQTFIEQQITDRLTGCASLDISED